MGADYNYDDQGQFFPYFVATIAASVTVPLTYSLLAPSQDADSKSSRISSSAHLDDRKTIQAIRTSIKRKSRGHKRLIAAAIGWMIIAWMAYLAYVTEAATTNVWDPYAVLGISKTADEREIKKHYRRMSLVDHPDKVHLRKNSNMTAQEVNDRWVDIIKAYKTLTDKEVRNNYLQYGHPDGKQSFSVGIALPKVLVEPGSGKYLLFLYAVLLALILPIAVGKWWYGSQRKTRQGILTSSAGSLFIKFLDSTDESVVLSTICSTQESAEAVEGAVSSTDEEKLEAAVFDERNTENNPPNRHDGRYREVVKQAGGADRKALNLMRAYLHRIPLDNSNLTRAKYALAPVAVRMATCQASIASSFNSQETLQMAYRISQHVTQAVPFSGSPLLQLPHMTPTIIRNIEKLMPHKNIRVQDLMRLSADTRKTFSVGPGRLTESQLADVEHVGSQLLEVRVEKMFFKTDGQPTPTAKSPVQLVIKFRFVESGARDLAAVCEADLEQPDEMGIPKKPDVADHRLPLAHAPYFADERTCNLSVYLFNGKNSQMVVPPTTFSTFSNPIVDQAGKPTRAIQTMVVKFIAPPQGGKYDFTCAIVSDSYIGYDTMIPASLVLSNPIEIVHQDPDIDDEKEVVHSNEDSDEESTESDTDTETESESED